MKSSVKLLLVAFAATSFTFSACDSSTAPKTEEKSVMAGDTTHRPLLAGEKLIYQCEMDPEVKSDKPGKCPKCGMDLRPVIVKDTLK